MISDKYLDELKRARDLFFNKQELPKGLIDDEILDSWIRSRSFNLVPNSVNSKILTQAELEEYREQDKVLYEIATEFIEYLYQVIAGSGFLILFANRDGYVLRLIGDVDIVEVATTKENPLIEGSFRDESAIGTNSIGTPMRTKRPIQLFAHEHYFELSADWTCSGAPILLDDEVIGVICICGTWDKVHAHTLGMAMAASEAISKQFSLTRTNASLTTMQNYLQTSIDSLHTGIFLLNEAHDIAFVNATTISALGYTTEELIGLNYHVVLPSLQLENITKNVWDLETTIQGKNDQLKVYVNIKLVCNSEYANGETFLISFRRSEYVKGLVNKVMGQEARYTFENIVGSSVELEQAKKTARMVANGNTSVLITGESGTGKELFAQSIHNHSPFRDGPFVALNCGAIPKDLIESELFGYDSGAFTGARKDGRAGKFELANNGTILLDEIGDMPFEVQVKLLRVLQEKTLTRVGGKKTIPLNVRVIAATNVDLELAIQNHTFRRDLFYRLNVFSLHIPPLSSRGEDIFILTNYFLEKYQNPDYEPITQIDSEVKEIFTNYAWPGNIRELENVIERLCILTTDGRLTIDKLPPNMLSAISLSSKHQSYDEVKVKTSLNEKNKNIDNILNVDEAERQLIIQHLACSGGNIKRAADSLGMSRRTLYRKLAKYEIDTEDVRVCTT